MMIFNRPAISAATIILLPIILISISMTTILFAQNIDTTGNSMQIQSDQQQQQQLTRSLLEKPSASKSSAATEDDDDDSDEDDDQDNQTAQKLNPPTTTTVSPYGDHPEEFAPRVNASQPKRDFVLPTTKTPRQPFLLSQVAKTRPNSTISYQNQPATDPRDLVEGSGNGPPSGSRQHQNEKYDDTEDGGDDDDDEEEDEDYSDKSVENNSSRVTQVVSNPKKSESIKVSSENKNTQVNHHQGEYQKQHQKTQDLILSSLNKGISLVPANEAARPQKNPNSAIQNVPTQLYPVGELPTTNSPPSLLNLMNVSSPSSTYESSNHQIRPTARPQQIPTTSTVTIAKPELTTVANSPANQTSKAGKNSKNHDEYLDYEDDSDDDDSDDTSNFEDNESNADQMPIKESAKHQTQTISSTNLTEVITTRAPTITSSTQPSPYSVSNSPLAVRPLSSTTKAPSLPDSIVDDVGDDDDEDDEEEDEDDEEEHDDVIEDNIDETGNGSSKIPSKPISPTATTSTTTSTTTTTTTSTTTTTTTTTTTPRPATTTTSQPPTTSTSRAPITSATIFKVVSPSTPRPVPVSTIISSSTYTPDLIVAPTAKPLYVPKPSTIPPAPTPTVATRFTPIRYATTPTNKGPADNIGTSSIMNYGRGSSVEDDTDLTVQLFNKVVEIYHSAGKAIQTGVDAVWPPSFEASTGMLEPLMAQPLLFMLALGAAIIGLVLTMMLVVYIVSYQIEPKDDISIY